MPTGPQVKRIICLANSRKMSGRCIAGKELSAAGNPGGWIRPVSSRPSEEVSEYERQYQDGSDPRVLDVIEIPMLNPQPKDYQQENWLIDNRRYWVKVDRVSVDQLNRITEPTSTLWPNGYSTFNGLNDRVPLAVAGNLRDSLRLIQVNDLTLAVSAPGADFGNHRRRVQGRFRHNEADYRLRVTDPVYERQYLQQPDGYYPVGECFLTISLGEPYQGHSYKLIAAIIK